MTAPTIEPAAPSAGAGEEGLIHTVCPRCYPHPGNGAVFRSLCGLEDTVARRLPDGSSPERACAVCREIRKGGCPTCGYAKPT